jgi:hypothetical protein
VSKGVDSHGAMQAGLRRQLQGPAPARRACFFGQARAFAEVLE